MNKVDSLSPLETSAYEHELPENTLNFLKGALTLPVTIESTLNSFSNINYKIRDAKGQLWVLRVPSNTSKLLSSYSQEKELLTWAKESGFSILSIKNFDETAGYLLSKFLQGDSLSSDDFIQNTTIEEAIDLLFQIHSSKPLPEADQFDIMKRFKVTKEVAQACGVPFASEVNRIGENLEALLSQIPREAFKAVLCHNDPSPQNFFREDARLYLLDWELAALNDPMWDVAHFVVLSQVEPDYALKVYPTEDPLAKDKIIFFKAYVLMNTLIWTALEKEVPTSSLSREFVENLYWTFLKKTQEHIESTEFKCAFINLCEGN